ncbi:MAG: hypothetical protein M5U22_21635 [Thermoleophilia bacterium]|nr:hypothetical protein [Thermoleophilia bacterium]
MLKRWKAVTRLGILAFLLMLALTAAYYYGTTRAQSVVALPSAISLTGPAAEAGGRPGALQSEAPSATTSTAKTGVTTPSPSQGEVQQQSATASTTGTVGPASPPPTSASRRVVTTIRGWECEPGPGTTRWDGGETWNEDCR